MIIFEEPRVRLRNHFANPLKDAISAARTCYSSEIISPEAISARVMERVGRTTYEGGHHTVYQHEMFEFEIEGVSRAFLHDYLHTHQFYNTSQQSQRYVKLDVPRAIIPRELKGPARGLFEEAILGSWERYTEITDLLFNELLEQRIQEASAARSVKKIKRETMEKAMEAARYDLCIAYPTFLIYTIDGVTLWRLYRLREMTWEAKLVLEKMVEEVKRVESVFMQYVEAEKHIAKDDMPEHRFRYDLAGEMDGDKFVEDFDRELNGKRSKLIGWTEYPEVIIGDSVRHVLGLSKEAISDEEATDLVLNPSKNQYLSEPLNLAMVSPLTRSLAHVNYTFKKKLSHTADSQDQRHRTVIGSRPLTTAVNTRKPDYVTPAIMERSAAAKKVHDEWMKRVWEIKNEMVDRGVPLEHACYVLPSALAIRFQETGSLMNLFYKYMNRSCLRAEEEIWTVTIEEIDQISRTHPSIGRYFGPPCYVRKLANSESLPEEQGRRRYCNQGRLYCRQPVWTFYPNVTIENILKV